MAQIRVLAPPPPRFNADGSLVESHRQCALSGCMSPARWWSRYCSDGCGQRHQAYLAAPKHELMVRRCAFNPKHTYRVKAGYPEDAYCCPDCASGAARLAMRQALRAGDRT